ncbi:MAG TPA: efflux RND transporter periplasmic adaptor subunit [Gammaproteobacteria bacterium]
MRRLISRGSLSARLARLIPLIGACALVVGACGGPPSGAGHDAATSSSQARDAALTVTTTEVAPTELARNVTLNGSINAWQEVIIAPEVGGYRVAEVHVDVGDRVVAGQTLVELSTALLAAEVATKEAALKQREAALVNAEAALERGRALSTQSLVSAADLDQLESDALVARAAVEAARADLETSRLRLQFSRVTASDDGIITSRTVTVGQIAQAGVEMLRLLRDGRIEWRGEVPEMRLGELEAGQRVTVMTSDGATFEGSIRVVAPTIASNNRTGLVYVDLAADDRLRPGMFARGEIEIGRGMGFTVPLASVVSADGYSYVFVLGSNNTVERRRITTGAVYAATIEVVDGLKGGERVVDQGAGFLKDGDLVNVAEPSGS